MPQTTWAASLQGDRCAQDDSFAIADREGAVLSAVCDAAGGAISGVPAAELALALLVEAFHRGDPTPRLFDVLALADAEIVSRRRRAVGPQRDPTMGRWAGASSTMDVVVVEAGLAHVAHVGNGRVYRVRDGVLERLTVDHTLANALRARGALHANEAPDVLVRSLGFGHDREGIESRTVDTQPGDVFVLCSDGLWRHVPDALLAEIAAGSPSVPDPAAALAAAAAARARAAGAHLDNVTVIFHRVPPAHR